MTKLIITQQQLNLLKEHLEEEISASDAYSDDGTLETIINGRRNVAFVAMMKSYWLEEIKAAGLKLIPVGGQDAYVVYREGSGNEASQLAKIAKKYGGYLSYEATAEETYLIGILLGYNKEDVISFVIEKYPETKEYFKNINIYK